MCNCVDIEIGSYGNQVVLQPPEHMLAYLSNHGYTSKTICVDACLEEEIKTLWAMGITTTGCCCGHNKMTSYIGVIESDIARMKALGYVVHPNEFRPGSEDSFYAKTVNNKTMSKQRERDIFQLGVEKGRQEMTPAIVSAGVGGILLGLFVGWLFL